MNQDNPGTDPVPSPSLPLKRKRGRPRKFPTMDNTIPPRYRKMHIEENAPLRRNPGLGFGENAQIPPGYVRMNSNRPWQPKQAENDILVGQLVHGVVEAVFDAGCLLSVKVGNSETTLRGVVFKPGHYVPVSAENDVAPHLQMIQRKDIPIPPVNNYPQVKRRRRRTRKSDEKNVAPRSVGISHPGNSTSLANGAFGLSLNGASAASNVNPSSVSQTGNVARGKLVPVVLVPQSTRLHNGASSSSQFQTQANHNETSADMPDEKILHNHPAEEQNDNDTKPIRASEMPFQKLLNEVMKRAQSPSKSMGSQAENWKPYATESDSGVTLEGEARESPLSVAPVQSVEPTEQSYSEAVPNPNHPEHNRVGKMTTLLQVSKSFHKQYL